MNMMFLPPKLRVLQRVSVMPSDHLDRLIASLWDGTVHEDVEREVAAGILEAYSTGECLVLIQTQEWPAGRELLIYGMAGSGILKQADDVVHDLRLLAEHKACRWIGAQGNPEGWKRIAKLLGFRPVSTHYVMELEDGR